MNGVTLSDFTPRQIAGGLVLLACVLAFFWWGGSAFDAAPQTTPTHVQPRAGLNPHACEPGPLSAATCR